MRSASPSALINGGLIVGFGVQPLLVTLGSLIWVRGLAQFASGGRKEYFEDAAMHFLGTRPCLRRAAPGARHAWSIVAIVAFVVSRTVFGRRLVAVGGNPSRPGSPASARCRVLIGSPTPICGMLAGLAGLFITARVGSSDPTNFGLLIELDAIAAVVVGGTALAGGRARVIGTLVGALVLQLVTAAMIMNNVSFHYALIVKAAIILARGGWRSGDAAR